MLLLLYWVCLILLLWVIIGVFWLIISVVYMLCIWWVCSVKMLGLLVGFLILQFYDWLQFFLLWLFLLLVLLCLLLYEIRLLSVNLLWVVMKLILVLGWWLVVLQRFDDLVSWEVNLFRVVGLFCQQLCMVLWYLLFYFVYSFGKLLIWQLFLLIFYGLVISLI